MRARPVVRLRRSLFLKLQVIYLDIAETQLTELGLSFENIAATLQLENAVVDAGGVDLLNRRLRIAPTGSFSSPEDIGDLTIRSNPLERAQALAVTGRPESDSELIRIRDIGTVRPGYADPPSQLMRFGGEPAIGISIANESGVNVVDVGKELEAHLAELESELPIGIEVHKVHWQSEVVSEAVNGFLHAFGEALVIIIVVVTLFMGWRIGVIIGFALIFTLCSTFILMAVAGMSAAFSRGLRVPDDISIVGWDDITVSQYLHPALSTVTQHPFDDGLVAATLLLEAIAGREFVEPVWMPDPRFVPRESSGTAPA